MARLLKFIFFLVLTFALPSIFAQDQCPLPPSPFSNEPNIFSGEQEMFLGEAEAERRQRDYAAVDNSELNRQLQQVGDRLLKYLPKTEVRYEFRLVDVPIVNSWGLAGGKIYVTRKMVAYLRNEEELAALLAHEIGHIYTHQQAIEYTRLFREHLRVNKVGDRDDVFRRYNELLDNWNRKHFDRQAGRSEKEQKVADQLALYALARADYSPQAFADFWDRFAETQGKTGGFFSDLFGRSKEENRRLREILKNMAAMPRGCVDQVSPGSATVFQKWQQNVIAYSGQKTEKLHAVIRKTELNPPIQTDFRQIKFSPDGNYILVQNGSGIVILRRDPLKSLFRIPALDAHLAVFAPDSKSVSFYTDGLRAETWSVSDGKQVSAHEIVNRHHCLETALSPDGRLFACYDLKSDLKLFDVATGAPVFEKKEFYTPNWYGLFMLAIMGRFNPDYPFHFLNLSFSPDGKFFTAAAKTEFVAIDTKTLAAISVAGSLRSKMAGMATFISPDRVAAVDGGNSGVFRFPSGEKLNKLSLRWQNLTGATQSQYLMLRPIDKYPVGVLDVQQDKLVLANLKTAADVYDGTFASEARDGELALSKLTPEGATTIAAIRLPLAQIGRLRAVSISDDLKWLAFSESDRGAVFDLSANKQVALTRGFRGAYAAPEGIVYTDFPKFEETSRMIGKILIAQGQLDKGKEIDEESFVRQIGKYLVIRKPKKKGQWKDSDLQISDVVSDKIVWSRQIPGAPPGVFMAPQSGLLILAGGISESTAKESEKEQYQLPFRFDFPDEKKTVYRLEVIDIQHGGQTLANILVDSGKQSFSIASISASPEFVAISDSENRVLVYSVKSGQQIGKMFGGTAKISSKGKMSVLTENDKIAVIDCATLRKTDEFSFSTPVVFSQFSVDGKQLFVLTADQTAVVLDLSLPSTTSLSTRADKD